MSIILIVSMMIVTFTLIPAIGAIIYILLHPAERKIDLNSLDRPALEELIGKRREEK